jgi:cytoskeletal protein CcmA (bactofilin family)
MLGMKKQLSVKSIIGPGMRVDGPVTFRDGLQIDGTVLGDVMAEAEQSSLLVISETGSVRGAIRADHVVIGGAVVGPVQAGELLELQSKARVEGDVQYKALEMQQGAIIAGELRPQLTPRPAPAGGEPAEPSLGAAPPLREPMFLDPDPLAPAPRDTRLF